MKNGAYCTLNNTDKLESTIKYLVELGKLPTKPTGYFTADTDNLKYDHILLPLMKFQLDSVLLLPTYSLKCLNLITSDRR